MSKEEEEKKKMNMRRRRKYQVAYLFYNSSYKASK
jgi:hypothetical protein